MKRILSITLCILLCLSFSSAFVLATDMDDNELPSVPLGPGVPLPTDQVRILVPESWEGVYIFDQTGGALGAFPGTMVTKQGMTCFAEIPAHVTDLVLSAPNGDQKTVYVFLEKQDLEILIILEEDTSCQTFYGIIGDVTGDGKLNIGDAAKIYSHLRGSNPFQNAKMLGFADVTGDGRVNLGDVAKLYRQIKAIPAA